MAQTSAASDTSSSSSSSSTFLSSDDRINPTPAGSVFLTRIAGTVRDTRSKVEQKKMELNATMQEKLPEWKSRGAMYGNLARETGMVWGKKGKDAVDRWKKQHQNPSSAIPVNDLHIFGMPLDVATALTKMEESDLIPVIIRRSVEYLDTYGVHEVGIYRIPGSTTTVNKLRAIFDAGGDMNFQNEKPDPHAVSTLLKMYLRELPEPIVPASIGEQYARYMKEFIASTEGSITTDMLRNYVPPTSSPELLEQIRIITAQLPLPSYALLGMLCRHLNRVDQYHHDNRMTASNLALIFTPTLRIGHALFHCMVNHPDVIFESTLPSAGPTPTTPPAAPTRRMSPPPLPEKPQHIRTLYQKAVSGASHAKTRSDTDILTITQPGPPPKPSRSPQNKPALDYVSLDTATSPDLTKRRSKSLSSTTMAPSLWNRPPDNGSRVGAIGRQFESLRLDGKRR